MSFGRLLYLCILLFVLVSQSVAQNFWEPTAGPYGGFVNTLCSTSGGVLAGTEYGGIYRTTNQGESWMQYALQDGWVSDLIVAPNGYFHAATTNGHYRSTNSGVSWARVGLTMDVMRIVATPSGELVAETYTGGHYRSTDNGSSWSVFQTGLPSSETYYYSLAALPNGHLFLSSDSSNYNAHRVYRSLGNGAPWEIRHTFSEWISTLCTTPNGTLYAAGRNVYRSDDEGDTWVVVDSLPSDNYTYCMAMSPDSVLYVGTYDGLYRHDGTHFAQVGLENHVVYSLELSDSSGALFAGTNRDVFTSRNGLQWTLATNGFSTTMIGSNAIVFRGAEDIFAGTKQGVCYSNDRGNHWLRLTPPEMYVQNVAVNRLGHLFAGIYNGIVRSTNNGVTWDTIDYHRGSYSYELYTSPLGLMYHGVYYSDSTGTGWRIDRSIDDGATWRPIVYLDDYVDCFAQTADSTLFVGTENALYRCNADGSNWIGVGFDRATRVVVGSNGWIYVCSNNGVHYSTDNGVTWTPTTRTSATIIMTVNAEGTIFAENFGQYVRSTDNGITWQNINTGIPTIYISALTVQPSTGVLYAGTLGSGIYRSRESTLSVPEQPSLPTQFALHPAYPNPFNNSTNISYSLPKPVEVKLIVFDALGREVETLVNTRQTSGTHRVVWNSRYQTSGKYWCRLQAGGETRITELLLVK